MYNIMDGFFIFYFFAIENKTILKKEKHIKNIFLGKLYLLIYLRLGPFIYIYIFFLNRMFLFCSNKC